MATTATKTLVFVLLAQQCCMSSALGRAASGSQVKVLRGRQNVTHNAADLRAKLREAINEALGEDNGVHHERLADIHKALSPMWQSLVKNRHGLVGVRTLRYAVHRYLLQAYAISFVGLEPQQSNSTLEEAQILMQRAPEYLRATLEGKAAGNGFSIEDAVALIATLESLVSEDGQGRLHRIYEHLGLNEDESLTSDTVPQVLDSYMASWILGDNILEWGTHDPEEWENVQAFNRGKVKSFEYDRMRSVQTKRQWSEGGLYSAFQQRFDFDDVRSVTDSMQKTFGDYSSWYCGAVKESLAAKDTKYTGRVKISDFHEAALGGNQHFAESKAYLREMGALDETSPTLGPQVIITNYLQASSNCIISTPHYRVCCQNECEGIFAELEKAIGGPVATPVQLLGVIANMTGSLEEDHITIDAYLVKQLEDIAKASQGKIPLHGRLFAQWLHYAFPHECPFPHKAGTARNLAPGDFGHGHKATEDEMREHVMQGQQVEEEEVVDKAIWLSQWTPEEELLADYTHLRAPWEVGVSSDLMRPVFLLLAGIVVVGYKYSQRNGGKGLKDLDLPIASKAHYI
eukprot:gnl/TRDRNA2_/TRDRNA2_180710_c0_seq1.p1 gnl/TRDRNA2_/TRDRNA2_180710_c0~~gnl/TRDRNA2_/TRDRNA2_180710_c0_seq1.p1  ORF type:complete len:573 (+),score=110.15 gnl/TRDRNA2_/TRDRNA2_180710_c0_seq1:83-1801(+)